MFSCCCKPQWSIYICVSFCWSHTAKDFPSCSCMRLAVVWEMKIWFAAHILKHHFESFSSQVITFVMWLKVHAVKHLHAFRLIPVFADPVLFPQELSLFKLIQVRKKVVWQSFVRPLLICYTSHIRLLRLADSTKKKKLWNVYRLPKSCKGCSVGLSGLSVPSKGRQGVLLIIIWLSDMKAWWVCGVSGPETLKSCLRPCQCNRVQGNKQRKRKAWSGISLWVFSLFRGV